ncbi:hypothetical protein D3C84_894930 [compost metagenome]
MGFLRGGRSAARQHARDDHQAMGTDFGRVCRMGHRFAAVDGTGADDGRNAGGHQARHAFLTLGFGQQRPVAHGTAIHHGAHANVDQLATLGHQRVEVRLALGGAWGHQCRDAASENVVAHCVVTP